MAKSGRRGSLIHPDRNIHFIFNGQKYQGLEGDTLASALLANGVKVVARSPRFARPRGLCALGDTDGHAMVKVLNPELACPVTNAGQVTLFEGLEAQACLPWGGLNWLDRAKHALIERQNAGF